MKNLIYVILFLTVFIVYPQKGKVIKIKDGDTIVILDANNDQHTIRVADIDCPEKGQPYYRVARMFVSDQIFGKIVNVKEKNKDRYGRIVGYVLYDGKNLSLELLKEGLAWHYKYYSDDKEMARIENKAKREKKGLWADPDPINPFQWRKGKRPQK